MRACVCLYKVLFCQNWWLRLRAHKYTISTHQQILARTLTITLIDDGVDVYVCFGCFSSQPQLSDPHNYVLYKFDLSDHVIAALYIISQSPITAPHWLLFLICGVCSACLYHDHLSNWFCFPIFAILFVFVHSFRIVSFTVSNPDKFQLSTVFVVIHCISCLAIVTPARVHKHYHLLSLPVHIILKAHPKLAHSTRLFLMCVCVCVFADTNCWFIPFTQLKEFCFS